MRIGLTGYQGKVGQAILRNPQGLDIAPIKCNILDLDAVHSEIKNINPDVIIHCAALTNVEYCEANYREAFNVNVRGTGNIVDAFTGTLIYLSTDHVFDGTKYRPYHEKDKPNPVNHYGSTKWGGELVSKYGVSLVKIVRASKLFDYDDLRYNLLSLEKGQELEFTSLISRSFLYVNNFIDGLLYFVRNIDAMPDLLNISGRATTNYYQFWTSIVQHFGYDNKLIKPRDYELKGIAPRPLRCGLNVTKAKNLGIPLFDYIDGLKLMGNQK